MTKYDWDHRGWVTVYEPFPFERPHDYEIGSDAYVCVWGVAA